MPKYAELIYNGFWFSPEREMLQAAIDLQPAACRPVRSGSKLYKGNVILIGRDSKYSLYDQDLVTFEEGAVAYDHRDAAGFIRAQCAPPAHARPAQEEAGAVKAPELLNEHIPLSAVRAGRVKLENGIPHGMGTHRAGWRSLLSSPVSQRALPCGRSCLGRREASRQEPTFSQGRPD